MLAEQAGLGGFAAAFVAVEDEEFAGEGAEVRHEGDVTLALGLRKDMHPLKRGTPLMFVA